MWELFLILTMIYFHEGEGGLKKKRVVKSIKDNTGAFSTNKTLLSARYFLVIGLTMISSDPDRHDPGEKVWLENGCLLGSQWVN